MKIQDQQLLRRVSPLNSRIALWICIASVIALASQRWSSAHEGHSHLALAQVSARTPSASDSNAKSSETADTPPRLRLGGPGAEAFRPFAANVSTRVEGTHLIVESNGLPDHDMMVGIRAWQQQVPLPQPFTGNNAWRLPLKPQPATQPISVLNEPLRGAIALAVNGVPIFCALNNRAEDTYLAGELDKWGGHCGRGDDYHYHIAPTHLEDIVGVGNPIAFALDGYPILGLKEADGSQPRDLDRFNGHTHDGHYHYHATETFPYVNGGLHGKVSMRGDQIVQPRDSPIRPGQPPLRGARITGFTRQGNQFDVQYEVSGKEAHVKYEILDDSRVKFEYLSPSGQSTTEVYQRGRTRRGSLGGNLWWIAAVGVVIFTLLTLVRRMKGVSANRT